MVPKYFLWTMIDLHKSKTCFTCNVILSKSNWVKRANILPGTGVTCLSGMIEHVKGKYILVWFCTIINGYNGYFVHMICMNTVYNKMHSGPDLNMHVQLKSYIAFCDETHKVFMKCAWQYILLIHFDHILCLWKGVKIWNFHVLMVFSAGLFSRVA
jgi:hypothetical protein